MSFRFEAQNRQLMFHSKVTDAPLNICWIGEIVNPPHQTGNLPGNQLTRNRTVGLRKHLVTLVSKTLRQKRLSNFNSVKDVRHSLAQAYALMIWRILKFNNWPVPTTSWWDLCSVCIVHARIGFELGVIANGISKSLHIHVAPGAILWIRCS